MAVSALPVPRGWFAVASSGDLPAGSRQSARIGGEEFVVWRTEGGVLGAAVAWCPHLGAHLGRGRVCGEQLECAFHGFRFGVDGGCQATAYGGSPPARAKLTTVPARETGGIILLWFDPAGGGPTFEVPEIDDAGYTRPSWKLARFAGHPLETTENSVDTGHLGFLHGYDDVAEIEPVRVDGATLTTRYQMTRGSHASGLKLPTMRTDFDITVHGLGVSIVDLTVVTLGVRQRLYVLSTPLGDGMVELRMAVSGRTEPLATMPPVLRRLPQGLVTAAMREFTLLALYYDVAQDRRIWTTKRHVPHPVLAEGDGPIGLYRRWAAQFFAAAPGSSESSAVRDEAV